MKVYVVVGHYLSYEDESYSILSKYAVKSTLEKAQKELIAIKEEIIENYENSGCDISWLDFKETETSLKVIYGNEDEENYTIEERIVDL